MSTRKIFECDRCGKRIDKDCEGKTIYATVDRRADAAGGMEDVCEPVDFCGPCAIAVLSSIVDKMDHNQATEWVVKMRKKP
jgi:hypothetical protein